MAFDINKILTESIQETLNNAKEEPKKEPEKKEEPITEGTTEVPPTDAKEESNLDHLQSAVAPAISAGLGALTLRNKIRSISGNIQEVEDTLDTIKSGLKTAGKFWTGEGAGAKAVKGALKTAGKYWSGEGEGSKAVKHGMESINKGVKMATGGIGEKLAPNVEEPKVGIKKHAAQVARAMKAESNLADAEGKLAASERAQKFAKEATAKSVEQSKTAQNLLKGAAGVGAGAGLAAGYTAGRMRKNKKYL